LSLLLPRSIVIVIVIVLLFVLFLLCFVLLCFATESWTFPHNPRQFFSRNALQEGLNKNKIKMKIKIKIKIKIK